MPTIIDKISAFENDHSWHLAGKCLDTCRPIAVNLGCNDAYIISVVDPGGLQGFHGLPFLASAMTESYASLAFSRAH